MTHQPGRLPHAGAILGLAALLAWAPGAPALADHNCGEPHGVPATAGSATGQANRTDPGCLHLDENDEFVGDPRPDAPALAYRGPHAVGVQTVEVVNAGVTDLLNWSPQTPDATYDRPLVLEVWYPAVLGPQDREITTYDDHLGTGPGNPDRPVVPFRFGGRAARGAMPDIGEGPYPLVIVSHGYPGSRVLMSNLTENLASKGYIVVAIDHYQSTHADKVSFGTTLLHRTTDVLFVLDEIAAMGVEPGSFLNGMVDDQNTALIGYSMGGYGALIASGAGLTTGFVNLGFVPGGLLGKYESGTPEYEGLLDPRIRASVFFAPCCQGFGMWSAETLSGMTIPTFFIVGDQDRTAVFDQVKNIWENATASDRRVLIYEGAIHEVPVNPAPPISKQNYAEWLHYQEPAWDNRKLNNVNQHFITAFLGVHLKGQAELLEYLDLSQPISNDSPRSDMSDPDYWTGFTPYGAIGMQLHHLPAE